MKILYKTLLDLELWHDYYLGKSNFDGLVYDIDSISNYNVSNFLELIPTPECSKILKSLRWAFRSKPEGGSIFASVDEVTPNVPETDFKTVISISRPYRLTFWLTARNQNFANFTNLPLDIGSNQFFYFSNLSNNKQEYSIEDSNGGNATRIFLFLTESLQPYQAGSKYEFGQLVTDNNSETWEAIKYQESAVSEQPDADNWQKIGFSQYVSVLDRQTSQKLSRKLVIPNVEPGDKLRFTLTNVNDHETFVQEVTISANHPSGDLFIYSLNFTGQSPGLYSYKYFRNDELIEEDQFVLIDPINSQQAFGLVEIVLNQEKVTSPFSFLQSNDGQTIIEKKKKTYIIRFRNRSTYWQYHYEKPHEFNEGNLLPDFELSDERSYITKRPQELFKNPKSLLRVGDDNDKHLLPVPDVTRIRPEIDDSNSHVKKVFSDIYL